MSCNTLTLFFSFILLSLSLPSFAQLEMDTLFNSTHVQSFTQNTYQVRKLIVDKGKVVQFEAEKLLDKRTFVFDTLQQVVQQIKYNPKTEKEVEEYLLSYTPQGQQKEIVQIVNGGMLNKRILFSYNNENKLVKKQTYILNDTLWQTINYQYKDTLLVAEKTYNQANTLTYHRTITYDSCGNLILFTNRKTLVYVNKPYSYQQAFDANNRRISKSFFDADNVLQTKWIYTYDKFGRLESEKQYNAEDVVLKATYTTYDKKNRINETYLIDNKTKQKTKTVYSYNKTNQYKKIEIFINDNKEPNFEKFYYYDSSNNWIYWVEFDNQTNTVLLSERQIEYRKQQ